MRIYSLFFAITIIIADVSFGAATENKNRFTLVTKYEGVQTIYIDSDSIVRDKDITQAKIINIFVKGGTLYNGYKAKYPSREPSFTTWTMTFDCSKLRAKVKDIQLYDDKQNFIDRLSADDRWNQLQTKNDTDKNLFKSLCR
jgi:hypothetical protein